MGLLLPADVMAEIDLSAGRLDEALQQVEKAIFQTEENGARSDYISALELQLRILLQLNRLQDVITISDVGIQMAEEIGYLPMLWRIRTTKAQALETLGRSDIAYAMAAKHEYQAATEIIHKLANNINNEELRHIFLSSPLISFIRSDGNETADRET
jgi:tetratricopeptide (TPR) repeat protein